MMGTHDRNLFLEVGDGEPMYGCHDESLSVHNHEKSHLPSTGFEQRRNWDAVNHMECTIIYIIDVVVCITRPELRHIAIWRWRDEEQGTE